jgi:hypothetical protein
MVVFLTPAKRRPKGLLRKASGRIVRDTLHVSGTVQNRSHVFPASSK